MVFIFNLILFYLLARALEVLSFAILYLRHASFNHLESHACPWRLNAWPLSLVWLGFEWLSGRDISIYRYLIIMDLSLLLVNLQDSRILTSKPFLQVSNLILFYELLHPGSSLDTWFGAWQWELLEALGSIMESYHQSFLGYILVSSFQGLLLSFGLFLVSLKEFLWG